MQPTEPGYQALKQFPEVGRRFALPSVVQAVHPVLDRVGELVPGDVIEPDKGGEADTVDLRYHWAETGFLSGGQVGEDDDILELGVFGPVSAHAGFRRTERSLFGGQYLGSVARIVSTASAPWMLFTAS
jgi:hypothetical protein